MFNKRERSLLRAMWVGALAGIAIAIVAVNCHAAKMTDLVLGGPQGTPTFIAFRNANFALHIGGIENAQGLPNGVNAPAYEYCIPTHYSKTKWLLDLEHETVTTIPGTDYIDYATPSNGAAYIRALKKWCAQVGTTRVFLDCIYETSPDYVQKMSAVFLVRDLVAGGLKVMVNDGDPYTASERDETKPAGYANKYATSIFIQDAIDLSAFNFSRYVLTCSVINSYIAMDKTVVVGIYDPNGQHPDMAIQFFGASVFSNPLVYGHYNVSLLPTVNVGLQIPGGKPVVEPQLPPGPTTLPSLGINSDLKGAPLYQRADNWWNLRVDGAPVDPNSAALIATIKSYDITYGGRFHPDFTPTYGIPFVVVDASTPLSSVTFSYASESDAGPYPIPIAAKTSGAYFENGGGTDGDRHLLLLNRDTWVLSELSYANWNGTSWDAGAGAIFDLKSNKTRPLGWTSTDAAGLAVLPGLVRPDEVIAGSTITHATRFSLKHTFGYVWPASHSGASDAGAPPLGLRIRLKASYDTSWAPAYLRPLFESWKTYGLICADRGGNCYVQGVMSPTWDNNTLNPAFHKLHITDFEVIKLGWKPTT